MCFITQLVFDMLLIIIHNISDPFIPSCIRSTHMNHHNHQANSVQEFKIPTNDTQRNITTQRKSWRWLCFGVFINKNRNLMQKQCSRKIQSSVFFGVCSSLHLSMSKTPFALLSVVIHSFFTSSISVVLFPFVVVVPSPEYRLLCPSFLWFHPLSKTEAIVLFFLPANTSTLCMKSPYLQNVVAFRLQHMYTPQHHRCCVYPFFWVHSSQTPFCCCHWGSMNKRTVCSFDMTVSLRSLMFFPPLRINTRALWASFCFRLCFSLSLKYAPSVIVLRPTEFTMNPKCMSTSSQERNYDWNLSCFYNSSKHSHRPIISVVLNTKLSYM